MTDHDVLLNAYETEKDSVIAWGEERWAQEEPHAPAIYAALAQQFEEERLFEEERKAMLFKKRSDEEALQEALRFRDESKPFPTFAVIASWFALHDCESCQEELDTIVNPADIMNDYACHHDGNRVYGFAATEQGITALQTLRGLDWCAVYMHKGDGSYMLADDDFLEELSLEALDMTGSANEEAIAAMLQKIKNSPRYRL